MREYLYEFKIFCIMYRNQITKMVWFGFVITFLVWHFVLKKPVYQRMYGTPTTEKLEIWNTDVFQDLPEQQILPFNVNGYDIEIQAIKSFKTVTRVVYVDRYNFLGTWYRSDEGARLYDKVVPQDISTATGQSGRHPKCFKYSHEYRLLEYSGYYSDSCPKTIFQNATNEISNNHSIAASFNVQRGLDILKAGDIAAIEGYAIYWNGTGSLSYQRFESAITLGQISKQLAGGMKTGLCRQLLITKITFDGYVFE